jgi:hypothetical protein
MKGLFEPIRITDLDIDLTQPSQEAPGLCHLYLKLSKVPPPEWVKMFEQERRFPRHPQWRNAWVDRAHIVIDCIPEDLGRLHLNHLKEDVAHANKKFLEWSAGNAAGSLRQFQENAAARKQLEELRAKLKFD